MKTYYLSNKYINDTESMDLITYLEDKYQDIEGYIYYAFPIIKELDMPEIFPNVFFITEKYGVYAFVCDDIIENREEELQRLFEKKELIDSNIFSRFIKNRKLSITSRELKFNFEVKLYLPNLNEKCEDAFRSTREISEYIESNNKKNNNIIIADIISTLEAADAIIKPKVRNYDSENKNSKAYVLGELESDIARFDDMQRVAALSMLEGPQRIRGLAGTGKTIILCMKAAMLHYRYPEKKILYTFYTRSLYDYIQQLITRFYIKISDGRIPDFNNSIFIKHAWGGENLKGVYYDTCILNNIIPLSLGSVRDRNNPFEYIYVMSY